MPDRIDLHTHSHCSDGTLSPAALVELAVQRQVRLLALTDHDTLQGCAAASHACAAQGVRFVPGVELSCDWQGREIHIIGLGVDPTESGLLAHCAAVCEQRRERVHAMIGRLAAAGLPAAELAAAALEAPAPTRTHLARALCRGGHSGSLELAFERWLKRGRPGYVAARWPALPVVVERICAAGGLAVLAHPHRYPLSGGQLRTLTGEFASAGGSGLEVSLAGMGLKDLGRVASLARHHGLAGSVGSDFHEPDLPWRPLGRFDKLPDQIVPITSRLQP